MLSNYFESKGVPSADIFENTMEVAHHCVAQQVLNYKPVYHAPYSLVQQIFSLSHTEL